ncbi:Nucleotide-binding, alpha-beta plait [Cynara cardunculus var. scolymus]|uniref:Nucleotide-binding, alpha-beta plait n=1 Tax=Cynara cardunculus var. scolymus TaxID=59895 RepID=A0A118K4V7_CYNCS|nr:Nucleotide-binding, alpha-beta plait [Cynara cardunculus var. scolymus]
MAKRPSTSNFPPPHSLSYANCSFPPPEKPTTTTTGSLYMAAATATAAAAIGSPFSKCNIKSKPWPSDPMFLRITSTVPMLQVSSSLSHSHVRTEPIPISGKWRVMKISASVAQEEAAVTVAEETPEPTEEVVVKEEEEEVSGDGDRTEANSSVNTKLYFGNLPYLCDSAQLAGIIQDYGSPELVEEYGGRTLRVNFSDKPKPKEPLYPETEYKLFVGNLSWSVTSESLTEMFNSHGNVVGARVLYDGETGRSRGYGFVSYSTKSEMETALQALDGMELEGRSMRVSLAEGKKQ